MKSCPTNRVFGTARVWRPYKYLRAREAGVKSRMNHVPQGQRRHRTLCHVAGVEQQDLRFVLVRVEPLDNHRAFHIDRLSSEVEARLGLIHIVDRSPLPRSMRQLVEKFAARLSGGGDAEHPE